MITFPKPRILIGALALMLATSVHADHIKVFLLGGQSNMQGNNALLSQLPLALQPPQDDVLLYSGTNSAAFFGSLQVGAGNNFGPEISFGRTIADGRPYDRFCLIKFAQGATSLHTSWDPASGSVYTEFRRTVTYGLEALTKAGHTYEIVGMCWTQGENDVQDFRTTAQYEADLNEFIADIRTRYGAGVKFFISRLSDNQTWRPASQVNEIRTAQDNVAATDPLSYLIDTDGFDMRADNLHFEETGYVDIGEAFGQAYLNSLPVDSTAPAIGTLSPAHTVSGVDPTADLTITFTEDITFGTGAIRLMQTGGTPVETFDVASPPANLTLSGATLTINPTALLSPTTGYYLEIDATAIDDLSGNSFLGISGDGTWSFTTSAADTTAPAIASLSPEHSATDILFNTNLHITFSENIAFGIGEIRLRQAGGTLVQSFDVASAPAGLTLSGTTLTINPSVDLAAATGYYVEIDATAIDDHAGNSFPGFIGDGTWSFTTTAALISGSKIIATASIHSGSTAMPFMTIDGSGLSGGVHGTAASTKWNTPTVDVTNQWIQWDLGASYILDSIHAWNYKDSFVSSIKSVDIYYSNAPIPGDPEGVGAGNWTKLGGASVQLPEAPDSPNTGFDLETATSTTLPDTEIRFIRFEANSNWQESTSYRTGLGEIQFTAKPGGPDLTAPDVSLLSPIHTATAVALTSNLSVTFNENVAFGTGAIRLRRQSDDSVIESFNVASPPAGLTLSGGTVTLNPTADLSPSTTYYVEIDATAIDDLVGNSFPGFSGDGTWRFTSVSADTTPPTINSLNPTHTATGISYSSNLVITFSENVAFGTGAIRLRRQSDDSVIESFDVASPPPNLTLSGSSVTLNPTADLAPATTYYVEIDATAIDDLAGNSFAGFAGDGTWRFTTFVPDTTAPTISTLNPENGATGVPVGANLVITFSENIAFGTGEIRLFQSGGGAPIESFDVATPPSGLTLSGATVTLDPSFNLALATTYYIEIDPTAIDDLAGNSFAGINGNGTWSFTTSNSATTAAITFVGTQDNMETKNDDPTVGWRNTTPAKTLDIDGDNIVGTDGYRTSNRSSNPSYATTSVVAPNTNNFSKIDDPNNPSGADVTTGALHDANAGLGVETVPLLEFVITGAIPVGEVLRVGVLIDSVGSSDGSNSATYTLKQTVGGSATATTPVLNYQDGSLDVAYFDVTGFSVGDTFVVTSTTSESNSVFSASFEQVIGITFDTGAIATDDTFSDWISGFTGLGAFTAFGDDADDDGIDNGVEAFFGTAPNAPNAGIAAVSFSGSSLTFTHPEADPKLSDVTGSYEWSLDLSVWNASGDDVGGTIVTIGAVQNTPESGTTTVTATVTGTEPGKVFVRVTATRN